MAGKKRRPARPGSLTSVKDVLSVVCQDLELDKKVQEMALLSLWPGLVGAEYAAYTRAVAVKKRGHQTVLWVWVANAALASDLTFRLEELRAALNRYQPQTGIAVDRIQLKVGSV